MLDLYSVSTPHTRDRTPKYEDQHSGGVARVVGGNLLFEMREREKRNEENLCIER